MSAEPAQQTFGVQDATITGYIHMAAHCIDLTSLNLNLEALVAEFISPQKCVLLGFVVGNIIPKSVKCIHSATKKPV